MNVEVLDPDQNVIWSEYDVQAGKTVSSATPSATTPAAPLTSQSWRQGHLQLHRRRGRPGRCRLRRDAATRSAAPCSYGAGTSYSGLLGDTDGADWYTVAMPDSGSLTVTLERGDSEDSATFFSTTWIRMRSGRNTT
jgi:hypothetical protein